MTWHTERPENQKARVKLLGGGERIVTVKVIYYWGDIPARMFSTDGYKFKACEEPWELIDEIS